MAELVKIFYRKYDEKMAKDLQTKLEIANVMAVPRLQKIVVNMGVKDATGDKKLVEKMAVVVGQITGQKPKIARAKKSIATFKLRQGDPIGVTVTLRGKRMTEFLERLINVVLPRIKDFRGLNKTSFDGRGNYALGFREYAVFPEIDPNTVDRMQGLEIIFVTSGKDNTEGMALLEAIGMPFQKPVK
jgi:large subunit ribosomal protein L5